MNIVFMGTPEFAVSSLSALLETGHNILGVFTQPDKPKNRGHKIVYSPVKEYALSKNLDVYQPLSMKDGEALSIIQRLHPDLIVVAAYGKILPDQILHFPHYGCINVHSSILPKYRGAAPINWAILNGEIETGVSIMYMEKALDAGDVLCTVFTKISPDENALELTKRLSVLGAEALIRTIDNIEKGTTTPIKQDESFSTYAPMLDKSLSMVNFNDSSLKIHNQVRGLIPWPCATALIDEKLLKIYKTRIGSDSTFSPGTILSATKKGIEIVCGDCKTIVIEEVQAEGGKRMDVASYLAGHPINVK